MGLINTAIIKCPRCGSENYEFVKVEDWKPPYFTKLVIACKECGYCPHYDE